MDLEGKVTNLAIVTDDAKTSVTVQLNESGSAFKFDTVKDEFAIGDAVTVTVTKA